MISVITISVWNNLSFISPPKPQPRTGQPASHRTRGHKETDGTCLQRSYLKSGLQDMFQFTYTLCRHTNTELLTLWTIYYLQYKFAFSEITLFDMSIALDTLSIKSNIVRSLIDLHVHRFSTPSMSVHEWIEESVGVHGRRETCCRGKNKAVSMFWCIWFGNTVPIMLWVM